MIILIKGREMPENCQECVCLNDEYFYCKAVGRQPQDENIVSRRPDWCPLTEVPPHGRLIDADAIPYKKIMYDEETDEFYYGVTKPYIDRMPTIIEAEEET